MDFDYYVAVDGVEIGYYQDLDSAVVVALAQGGQVYEAGSNILVKS